MSKKLVYLTSFVLALILAVSVQAESFSIRPAADVTLGNDEQLGPDITSDGIGLHARDISVRRRVSLISYDISELKGKGPVSNVSFNHVSWDQHGETNVYGIIEDLDLFQVELLTWNTAPGVQNDPTPALGSPVALDMNDLTDILVTFTGPGESSVRFSTGTSQALDDFINSDTDGILTFLLAPSKEGNQLIILSSEAVDGSLLEGILVPADAEAYYAMENNVVDSSGNGYDGILFGEPDFVKGVEGMAVGLDYSDDYVELPIGSLISTLTDCTITTWLNWPGLGGAWQRIFDFGSSTQINMFLTSNEGGASTPRFAITLNGAGDEDRTTAPDVMPTGWHHMAVTIDLNNMIHSLYIDGIVVAQNTAARYTPSSLGETTQNYLGKSQYTWDPLLYGSLDEFVIYHRTLSETEIAEIVAQQMPEQGPIAHLKFDEAGGDIAYDSAGKYDGILFGNPQWRPEGGMVDGALEFNGVDDGVYTESYFVLNTAYSEFSVFAWVKGGAPSQVIISQYGRDRDWLYANPADGCLTTELRHDIDNDPLLLSQAVITDGEWHRVGLVWDLTYRTLYVDDVEVASDEQESIGALNGGLNIGTGKGWNPASGSYWSGLIDDVKIYNRAVTP